MRLEKQKKIIRPENFYIVASCNFYDSHYSFEPFIKPDNHSDSFKNHSVFAVHPDDT